MYNIIYKRTSKSYFFLMVIWLLSGLGTAYAQEIAAIDASELPGIVIDQYGRPVKGVEISIKKSDFKTVSSEDGTFNFDAVPGTTLVFSHPDYLLKEIKVPINISQKKAFKVDLKDKKIKNPDTIELPYRGAVDKDSYLGAASTIYSGQIESTLSANLLGAMTGRMPGLNITQTRGYRQMRLQSSVSTNTFLGNMAEVGRGNYGDNTQFSYLLRGATSPVVIVDGFEGELFNLDVENIESISAQKDALSSMFLGGRSSRGVLYITTKKTVAEGFKVSFTGRYGIQKPIKMPKPLSGGDYVYLLNEARINDGEGPLYTPEDLRIYREGSSEPSVMASHPNVNWYDQILKNSSAIQSYSLNATGGGKTAQYFVSLGYMAEDGLYKQSSLEEYDTNAKYERYLLTSKVNVNVLDNLKMEASLIGRIEDGRDPGYNTDGANTDQILKRLYILPSNAYPIYNNSGSYAGIDAWDRRNLLADAVQSGYNKDITRDGMGSVKLIHDMSWLTEGLSARMIGSIASQSRSGIIRSKRQATFEYNTISKIEYMWNKMDPQKNDFTGVSNYQYMYGQIALDYTRALTDQHTIGGTLSADLRDVIDNYQLPERPGNIYAEAKYDYKKKYFAQAAINRSYLNRYGPGKRWGTFYAFGLGWDISKENFLSDVKWVNKLKLRTTYGETGNSIGRGNYYTWRQQYAASADYAYPLGSDYTNYPTESATGIIEDNGTLSNPNLTWERAHKLNVGIDANLFNNKLWITADFYRDSYFDLLRQRGKSIELIGLKYPSENIGKNLYQGFDLSVTYQNNIADLNYYITANWNVVKSEIKFMDEQQVPYDYMRQTGRPVEAYYGFVADGLFQSREEIANSVLVPNFDVMPGDIKYKDINDDGVINEFDVSVIGNDKPKQYFGIDLGFEYKGFEVSAFFQGTYNRDIDLVNAGNEYLLGFQRGSLNGYSQAYEHSMMRWTPETAATATFPRLSTKVYNAYTGWSYNTRPIQTADLTAPSSSFWIRSGDFIRLKNLSVSYTLPDSFSRNCLGGVKVKIFVTGQNIWTMAACDLVDPEIMDFRNYPLLKGFNTGINIKF